MHLTDAYRLSYSPNAAATEVLAFLHFSAARDNVTENLLRKMLGLKPIRTEAVTMASNGSTRY